MERKFLTHKGIEYKPRYAVLSANYIAFTKALAPSEAERYKHWPDVQLNSNELYEVFMKHDKDSSHSLDVSQVGQALQELNLYDTEEATHQLFNQLDINNSGDLDWAEFNVLAKQSAWRHHVVDFIPLDEIIALDFEVYYAV